jgi:hypothetical protein
MIEDLGLDSAGAETFLFFRDHPASYTMITKGAFLVRKAAIRLRLSIFGYIVIMTNNILTHDVSSQLQPLLVNVARQTPKLV